MTGPSDNGGGVVFSDFGLFQGLRIDVCSGFAAIFLIDKLGRIMHVWA